MMVPFQFRPLTLGRWNYTALRVATRFLTTLWDYDDDAYTFIGTRVHGRWKDHPIKGDRAKQVTDILTAFSPERHDVYFCPNAFSEPKRRAVFALPSRYAHCDIDDADPDRYNPQPNILWRTSPGRHQGIWIWQDKAAGAIAEQYSRNIVYKCGGDSNGWSVTKMLRLPGTMNHKPEYKTPFVKLLAFDSEPQVLPARFAKFSPPRKAKDAVQVDITEIDAQAIMRKYRRALGLSAGTLMMAKRATYGDRSKAIFIIILALIGAEATDSEIAAVLLANVYFLSRHGPDLDVAEQEIARIRAKVEADQ